MNRVGTDKTEHRDAGDQDGIRQTGDLCKAAAAQKADAQHEELYQNEARKEGVGHRGVLSEELRPRCQALDYQAAHEDSGNGLARNAECQSRNQRAARDGIVRRFGTGHAFDGALAEHFLMSGELTGSVVTKEAGNRSAGAGQDTDEIADDP